MARPIRGYPYAIVKALPRFPMVPLTRWGAVADLFIVFVAVVAGQVAMGGLAGWLIHTFPSLGILWLNVLIGLVSLASVGLVLCARRQSPASIGLGKPPAGRTLVGALAAVPACYIAVFATVGIYVAVAGIDIQGMAEEREKFFEMVPDLSIGTVLMITVFVGLHEEILFRGFVLSRLSVLFGRPVIAVFASGIVFGLLHFYQGPIGVAQTTAVGLVLAGVVVLTRTLWPAILAHAAFDTIGLTLIPLLRGRMQDLLDQLGAIAIGSAFSPIFAACHAASLVAKPA